MTTETQNIPTNVADAITALRAIIDALALNIDCMTDTEFGDAETLGNWREMVNTPPDNIRELASDAAYNISELEGLGMAIRDAARDALRAARPHIDEIEEWLDEQETNS